MSNPLPNTQQTLSKQQDNYARATRTFSALTLMSASNAAAHDDRKSSHVTMLSQKMTAVGLCRTMPCSSCRASSRPQTDGNNDYDNNNPVGMTDSYRLTLNILWTANLLCAPCMKTFINTCDYNFFTYKYCSMCSLLQILIKK